MKQPTIAIDIDDVLAQGTESIRLQVNKLLGINLQPEHYAIPGDYWRYYERVWTEHGIANKVDWSVLDAQMVIDQSHMPAFPEARRVLGELAKKYKLVVVTARNISWEAATKVWLDTQFPGVFSGVFFAGRLDSPKSKGEICAELGVSWLIDDNVDHAHTAVEQGVKVILFGDYGWHKGREIHETVVRCKDWQDVSDYLYGRND